MNCKSAGDPGADRHSHLLAHLTLEEPRRLSNNHGRRVWSPCWSSRDKVRGPCQRRWAIVCDRLNDCKCAAPRGREENLNGSTRDLDIENRFDGTLIISRRPSASASGDDPGAPRAVVAAPHSGNAAPWACGRGASTLPWLPSGMDADAAHAARRRASSEVGMSGRPPAGTCCGRRRSGLL